MHNCDGDRVAIARCMDLLQVISTNSAAHETRFGLMMNGSCCLRTVTTHDVNTYTHGRPQPCACCTVDATDHECAATKYERIEVYLIIVERMLRQVHIKQFGWQTDSLNNHRAHAETEARVWST